MLDKKKKDKIIAAYQVHKGDTGSSQVQIAILTEDIRELTKHLKTHKKDFSSRRGLLRKVAERRKLLEYLRREDEVGHSKLVKSLKLKVVEPKALNAPKLADEIIDDKPTDETEEIEADKL